jgi:PHD/YefM family antitoxin component YafN of YafNO toxin-antitoxin module
MHQTLLGSCHMTPESPYQYVSDANGNAVAVIVPIDVWREIESERETAYLLKSDAMRQRLLEAKNRIGGVSLDEVRQKLGV